MEILFQAGINPAEQIDNLAPSQLKRLFLKMREAIKTTIVRRAAEKCYKLVSSHLILSRTHQIRIYNDGSRQSFDMLAIQALASRCGRHRIA